MRSFFSSDAFSFAFPSLTRFLERSSITNFSYQLYTWSSSENEFFGFLCSEHTEKDYPFLHEHHNLLLNEMGAILTTFGSNNDNFFTQFHRLFVPSEANVSIGQWESFFVQICQEENKIIELDLENYITFSTNKNETFLLYHNETSELLVFSIDNAFDNLIPYKDYPIGTLYRFEKRLLFSSFVELFFENLFKQK